LINKINNLMRDKQGIIFFKLLVHLIKQIHHLDQVLLYLIFLLITILDHKLQMVRKMIKNKVILLKFLILLMMIDKIFWYFLI
jgi:hypothetical protein